MDSACICGGKGEQPRETRGVGLLFSCNSLARAPDPIVQCPRTTCHAQVSMEKGFETRQFIVMHCHSAGWAVAVDCNTVLCKKNGLRIHNTATLMSGHSLCAPYAGEHHRTRARLTLAVPISRKGPLEVGKFYSALPGTLLLLLRTSEKVAQGRDVRARLLCTTLGTSLPTEDYTYVCMRLCGRRDARSDVSQGTTHRPHRGPGDGQLQLADMDHVVNAMPQAADWPVMRRPHIFFLRSATWSDVPVANSEKNFTRFFAMAKPTHTNVPKGLQGELGERAGCWEGGGGIKSFHWPRMLLETLEAVAGGCSCAPTPPPHRNCAVITEAEGKGNTISCSPGGCVI